MAHINRFIVNSDYLSLARVGNYSQNVTIPIGYIKYVRDAKILEQTIKIPAPKGAIARTSISYTPPDWGFGTRETTSTLSSVMLTGQIPDQQGRRMAISWYIFTFREKDKLKITAVVFKDQGLDGTDQQFPSLPIKINVSYFYPPNIK